jgi:hypothetical protein
MARSRHGGVPLLTWRSNLTMVLNNKHCELDLQSKMYIIYPFLHRRRKYLHTNHSITKFFNETWKETKKEKKYKMLKLTPKSFLILSTSIIV